MGFAYIKNPWLKLFLFWGIIRTAIGFNITAFTALIYSFTYIMFIQVSICKLKKQYIPIVLNAMCIMALVQTGLMILNYYGIWFLALPNGTKGNIIPSILQVSLVPGQYVTTGFLSNLNMAGAFLALCLPAFFRKKWIYCIPFIAIGICISKSMGGIVPAFVAIVLFLLYKLYFKKRDAFFLVSLLLSIGIAYLVVFRNLLFEQTRFEVWGEIWEHIVPKKPVVGWGLGSFKMFFPTLHKVAIQSPHAIHRWLYAHNEYLQLLVEQGAIGLAIMLGYIVSLFKGIFNSKVTVLAVIAISVGLLNSGVNFLMHTTGGILLLIWIIILEKEKKDGIIIRG